MKKLSKKTVIILTAAILLLAVVLGIFVIPFYRLPAPVTLWEKKQLEEEYNRLWDWPPVWMNRNGEGGDTFYYGKYNGYYIIGYTLDVQWLWYEDIGGYEFRQGDFALGGMKKDGKYYALKDLYESGKISDDDLAKIYKYYKGET